MLFFIKFLFEIIKDMNSKFPIIRLSILRNSLKAVNFLAKGNAQILFNEFDTSVNLRSDIYLSRNDLKLI